METRPKIECAVAPEQPEPTDPGRVFDADPVAPRDAAESFREQVARGGGPDRVVEETYDTKVKIGEALEASAREIRDQPVETSDAAAVRAAERYAVGAEGVVAVPGGVAERAQAAADANARAARDEDKVTFADVLTWESTVKLPTGVAVTSEVASTAAEAEAANDPGGVTRPGGVSHALKRAAMHNREHECAS